MGGCGLEALKGCLSQPENEHNIQMERTLIGIDVVKIA